MDKENFTEQKSGRRVQKKIEDNLSGIGFVKKGISKALGPIPKRKSSRKDSDILEDSLQQDFEFFKKFPKQPGASTMFSSTSALMNPLDSSVYEALRDSTSMLADIEAEGNFSITNASYNIPSSLQGSGKKSYHSNSSVSSVTRSKSYLPQPSTNINL